MYIPVHVHSNIHVHVDLYMVHVCTNGVEYRLKITYIEGPSSLFACVMTFAPPFMWMVIGDIYTIMSITACARRRVQICIRRYVCMYIYITI